MNNTFDSFFKYNSDVLNAICENKSGDIIFCGRDLPAPAQREIEGDRDYDDCDRKQYVFSTMDNPVYVMYPNGYASQIKTKYELLRQRILINFLTNDKNSLGKGVYIVETYAFNRLGNASREFSKSIVERFNSLNFRCERVDGPNFANTVYAIPHMDKAGNFMPLKTAFRVATFIPEELIYEKRRIYNPDSGLVIGFGNITERTQHPCSNRFVEDFKKLKCDGQNFVEIEVIDNHSNQEYWIKVGNKLFKLDPTRDINRAEACHVDLHVNNVTIAKYVSNLEDLHEHGIYHTKAEAEAEGNLEFKLKILEMENKQQAIENEKMRLTQEVTKLQNEKEKLEVEKAKLSLDRYKITIDYKITEQRYKYELTKMVLEVKHVKDKLTLFKYGAILDLMKKKFDMEYNIKIKDEKFNYSTENSFDNVSSAQNMISNAFKTAKLLMGMA